MFNKREKEFNELMDQVANYERSDEINVRAAAGDFAAKLAQIQVATDVNGWIEAVRAALEALAAKLYGNGDRPKWTKIASAAVQIAAFVVTMIRSLKQLNK